MKTSQLISLWVLVLVVSPICGAQVPTTERLISTGILPSSPISEGENEKSAKPTLSVQIVKSPSELAESLSSPECDSDGSVYFITSPDGVRAIHKLNARGERVALFQPISPGVRVDMSLNFALARNGDVYQLIHGHDGRYVFVYKPDGGLKSTIKLKPGVLAPSKLAVFPSGEFLVAGLQHDKDRQNPVLWPFTGIFSADGTLKKELTLADDEAVHDLAASGDPTVRPADRPESNFAVSWGAAETGSDGLVYLMRRLSPAIFYGISANGDVVTRFTVAPGRADFMPVGMHVSGDRMAVLFWHPQTHEELLKIVDLKGHPVETVAEPVVNGKRAFGVAFTCYARNPERFTFLQTADDRKLELTTSTLP